MMSSPPDAVFQQIGRHLPRTEDYRLLTGQGRFIDDLEVPGALHACFVRSPHAHARIVSIDGNAARAMPGVVAVVTGQELALLTTRQRMAPPIDGLMPTEMDTLPSPRCASRATRSPASSPTIDTWPKMPSSKCWSSTRCCPPSRRCGRRSMPARRSSTMRWPPTWSRTRPPCTAILRAVAPRRIAWSSARSRCTGRRTCRSRLAACIAVWDAGRSHLSFHVGCQVPHPYRTNLAARLRLGESQVTVISRDVGGAFGQKIALYREELTVAAMARHLNRPVRWREDRMENLLASTQAREDFCRTRAAVTASGKLLSLELEIVEDFGAYSFFPGNYLARVVAMILTGPYKVQDYGYDVKVVLSNKVGCSPMRAPMAITSWLMEGTMDAIANALDVDPVEVRRLNMLHSHELPYTMATGEVLADVTPRETMEAALAAIDVDAVRQRQRAALEQGRYVGLGICTVVESTTYGSRFYKAAGIPGSGHESAWIRIEPSGAVNASVGLGATGQGYETSLAQAVAEGLGVEPDTVRVHLGHTDIAPYGMGSRGARGGTAGGGTLFLCARDAQAAILAIAAHQLALADPLRLHAGRVEHWGGVEWMPTGLALADIARIAYLDPIALPEGMSPGLEFHKSYDPPPMTYSNSTHVCEVEVDAATGAVSIRRYIVAEDCGTVLSPVVVEGQQHGAIAMGLSGTLFEHIVYDESGQNLSGSLADYLVATASDLPTIEILSMHTPSRSTPAGIKGMAEGGVMGSIGALGNAVADALAPLRVIVDRHPLTPMYLRSLIRDATASTTRDPS